MMPKENCPASFDAGDSMYPTRWPLVKTQVGATGNQSWILFINSKTCKGPLAFLAPYFWSRHTIDYPQLHGN